MDAQFDTIPAALAAALLPSEFLSRMLAKMHALPLLY